MTQLKLIILVMVLFQGLFIIGFVTAALANHYKSVRLLKELDESHRICPKCGFIYPADSRRVTPCCGVPGFYRVMSCYNSYESVAREIRRQHRK